MRHPCASPARTFPCPMPPIWKSWRCPRWTTSWRRPKPCATGLNMSTQILMPALSPTMEEGKLAKWHVKEGDTVKAGDILAEIETDKATMEFESIDEGRIGKILVPEGAEGVKVNAPIAVLAGEGEDAGAAEPASPKRPADISAAMNQIRSALGSTSETKSPASPAAAKAPAPAAIAKAPDTASAPSR